MEIKIKKLDVISESNYSREADKQARLYIWPEGETVLENLRNRHDRPYDFYKKEVLPIIKENLKMQGIDIEGMKISWSQYAGCKCGCSPGFIINGLYGKSIHVTIEEVA